MTRLFPRLARADDRLALDVGGDALTYRELAGRAVAYAQTLADLPAGSRIGVWTHPSLDTLVALVGHAVAGHTSVPLNPKLGPRELAHVLGDAAPARVVAARGIDVSDQTPGALAITGEVGRATALPARETDAPLLVLYTSGTTGAPKGAAISARAVAHNLDALAEAWDWTDADDVAHALPLFHVHGLVLGAFGSLRVGGALRLCPKFSPAALAATLADASMLFAVPTMIQRLADFADGDADALAAMRAARLLVSGSAGLPVREHTRVAELAGRGVTERYGLTETLINCAVRAHEGARPGTVGRPLRDVALRLVDDEREPVEGATETPLEVAVRTPGLFDGYLNRPDATAEVLDDEGWFYTGDLALRREDGAITILGRRSVDLIKTGGYKVGAGEIEACLLEHPAVAEVAVVGVPDEDLGQRIEAFVVLRPGAAAPAPEALRDEVAEQLTPHKRPRAVRYVEALPRNAMGKVQKKRLLPP